MHVSRGGSEQALVGKAVIFVRMEEKEVLRRRQGAEKRRDKMKWRKGFLPSSTSRERERDAGFLNGGVFA